MSGKSTLFFFHLPMYRHVSPGQATPCLERKRPFVHITATATAWCHLTLSFSKSSLSVLSRTAERVLRDASPLLGERSWHKPYRNGIQRQRSVNEVLIAFIKTLTKELKWQKLPFPLKIHINNQKYINNHCGLHCFEEVIQTHYTRAWKDHFNGIFCWILY